MRTLAAVARAKARNQNSDAADPMKPANSDGRHSRTIDTSTDGLVAASQAVSTTAWTTRPAASVNVAGIT